MQTNVQFRFPNAMDEGRGKSEQPGKSKILRLIGPVADVIAARWRLFSVLGFVLGILWVCLFPLVCITTGELKCRRAYFDENALSAGGGKHEFSVEHLRSTAMTMPLAANMPAGILEKVMARTGLEDIEEFEKGMHVGVLRPRIGADRRGSIVLVSTSPAAFKIAMAVVKALADVTWLSKALIVVSCPSSEALRRWVDAYHNDLRNMTRAGMMIGGLVLDVKDPPKEGFAKAINILVPGSNGELPNLDLVNVVVHLLKANGPTMLPNVKFTRRRSNRITELADYFRGFAKSPGEKLYVKRMENLVYFMQGVIFGPSGWHAHLVHYDIQAVTLELEYTNEKHEAWTEVERGQEMFGRTVEQTFRSLSNLEEKLHVSYFLYVLPDLELFVSIGEYSGSLILVLSPLLIRFMILIKEENNADPLLGIVCSLVSLSLSVASGVSLLLPIKWPHKVYLSSALGIAGVLSVIYFGEEHYKSLQALLMLLLVVTHGMIGMVNYPLAFFSAVLSVPFIAMARPSAWNSPLRFLALSALGAVSSPLLLVQCIHELVELPEAWLMTNEDLNLEESFKVLAAAYSSGTSMLHGPLLFAVVLPAQITSFGIFTLPSKTPESKQFNA